MSNESINKIEVLEGKTLDDAYAKASALFKCSVNDLKIDIIQNPSKGFFGLFSKNAIIKVEFIQINISKIETNTKIQENQQVQTQEVQTLSSKLNISKNESKKEKKIIKNIKKEKIFNDFYNSTKEELHKNPEVNKELQTIEDEIAQHINKLFLSLCYNIDKVKVNIIKDIILVEFSGADSALLIGKEGYRYKAISYLLFNWLSDKYGLTLRLEIAEFLKNQEEAILSYLEPVIEIIKDEGFIKTKILDGILINIALTKLRDEFPDKYVAVKTTQRGEKYILVNEYRSK